MKTHAPETPTALRKSDFDNSSPAPSLSGFSVVSESTTTNDDDEFVTVRLRDKLTGAITKKRVRKGVDVRDVVKQYAAERRLSMSKIRSTKITYTGSPASAAPRQPKRRTESTAWWHRDILLWRLGVVVFVAAALAGCGGLALSLRPPVETARVVPAAACTPVETVRVVPDAACARALEAAVASERALASALAAERDLGRDVGAAVVVVEKPSSIRRFAGHVARDVALVAALSFFLPAAPAPAVRGAGFLRRVLAAGGRRLARAGNWALRRG